MTLVRPAGRANVPCGKRSESNPFISPILNLKNQYKISPLQNEREKLENLWWTAQLSGFWYTQIEWDVIYSGQLNISFRKSGIWILQSLYFYSLFVLSTKIFKWICKYLVVNYKSIPPDGCSYHFDVIQTKEYAQTKFIRLQRDVTFLERCYKKDFGRGVSKPLPISLGLLSINVIYFDCRKPNSYWFCDYLKT